MGHGTNPDTIIVSTHKQIQDLKQKAQQYYPIDKNVVLFLMENPTDYSTTRLLFFEMYQNWSLYASKFLFQIASFWSPNVLLIVLSFIDKKVQNISTFFMHF